MFPIFASAAALLLVTPIHSADVSHASKTYHASYQTESTVRFQQVEPRFAVRAATPVCRWQAELVVNRAVSVEGQPLAAVAKPIHRFAPLSGSHAGSCGAVRGQIDAEVARYARTRSAEAEATARQDGTVLRQELDGIRVLSVKGG